MNSSTHGTALFRKHVNRLARRLKLEALETRDTPSFTDGFEGPSLDPFWTKTEISGFVTMPSTERVHSGSQSVKFTSTNSAVSKNIGLSHDFGEPKFGQMSIWFFDTGAGQPSSNQFWFSMSNSILGKGALLAAADYGIADGVSYYWDVSGDTAHVVTRTPTWHQFTFDSRPTGLTLQIDGQTVYSGSEAFPFDRVSVKMAAPSGRPAWTSHWDDFAFVEFGNPDLKPESLAWNPAQGGIDFGYKVTNGDLTQPTTAGLYWSADTIFDPVDTLAYSAPIEPAQGEHGPVFVGRTDLGTVPAGATHLLLVLDAAEAVQESDETNNVLPLSIPNVRMLAATTDDSRSLKVEYWADGADMGSVPVRVFRSADGTVGPGDEAIGDFEVPGTLGDHTGVEAVTLALAKPLAINPSKPFVLVQADPDMVAFQTTRTDDEKGFRKRVLGVVTHGYQPIGFLSPGSPAFIWQVANALRFAEGYDRAAPFNWVRESSLPLPGQTVQAASRMAELIERQVQQMDAQWPDDVIDIHLIGHSRGAVVIDQALVNPRLLNHPEVVRGTVKMTMIDPHPARNYDGTQYYSVIPPITPGLGTVGIIAEAGLRAFQAAANDPLLFRPPNADWVENYFQRTPALLTGIGKELILNLWGEGPLSWADYEKPLTGQGMNHSRIVDWYIREVLGTLGTAGTPPGAMPSPPESPPALVSAFPSDPVQLRREVREFSRVIPRVLAQGRNLGFRSVPAASAVLRTINSPTFWNSMNEAAMNWSDDGSGNPA